MAGGAGQAREWWQTPKAIKRGSAWASQPELGDRELGAENVLKLSKDRGAGVSFSSHVF